MENSTPVEMLPDTESVLAELDLAMAAYAESIERGILLAQSMIQLADSIESDLKDARAILEEWT